MSVIEQTPGSEVDSLAALEDRVLQAVRLVARLRKERDAARAEAEGALAEKDNAVAGLAQASRLSPALTAEKEALESQLQAAQADKEQLERVVGELKSDLADARHSAAETKSELAALRTERKQVRARIEKLLGQIDQLSGA